MKMKSLFFAGMLVLLLAALCSCSGGRCSDGCKPGVLWETVESTCAMSGYDLYVCPECGYETHRIGLPLLEHTPSETWSTYITPTCKEDGKEVIKCTKCDKILEERILDSYAHNLAWTTETKATCTTKGKRIGKCTHYYYNAHNYKYYCDYSVEEEIDALGHDWKDRSRIAPTCSSYGREEGVQCDRCDTWQEGGEQIAKLPHTTYDVEAIAATCTASGKTAGTSCSVCRGVVSGQNTVSALGHDFNVFTNKCTRCSKTQLKELKSKSDSDNREKGENFAEYLDYCIDYNDTSKYYYTEIEPEITHVRIIGTAGVTYRYILRISKRTQPITIDIVNAKLTTLSGYSIIDCPSDVQINLNFYGTECALYGGNGNNGANGGLGHFDGYDGADGSCAINVKGDLNIKIYCDSVKIQGGNGGNGGKGGDPITALATYRGGNGGDGAYAIYASSIKVTAKTGYSTSALTLIKGSGGARGQKGYSGGKDGSPGNDAPAKSNVPVQYP